VNLLQRVFANRQLLVFLWLITFFCVTAAAQKKGAAPSPGPASPPAAGAAGSNAPVEVEWLSYSALDKIVKNIADYTCGSSKLNIPSKVAGTRVVVLDPPAIQALQVYDTFYAQAEAIRMAFVDMAPKAGAGGGVDDFADITGAVVAAAVSTTSETSSSFTIQDPTAAIMLLSQLKNSNSTECRQAHYAGVYEVSEIGTVMTPTSRYVAKKCPAGSQDSNCPAGEDSPIQVDDAKVAGTQELPSVPAELTNLAKTRADTLLGILNKRSDAGNPKICNAGSNPSKQDPCVNAFNTLDSTYNAFLTALSTPNSTTGQPAESAAKQGYKLRALFEGAKNGAPVIGIYLSVAAAGGTQQDRKNLITAVFTGDWIRYSGGASLNVIIFKETKDGSQILLSNLAKFRTQLTTIKSPSEEDKKSLNEGSNLDEVFKP
jgi:hypothetical protein